MKQLDRDLMFYVILLHQTGFTWSTPNPLTGQISTLKVRDSSPALSVNSKQNTRPSVHVVN